MKAIFLIILLAVWSSSGFTCDPSVTVKEPRLKHQVRDAFKAKDLIAFVYVSKVENREETIFENAHVTVVHSFKGDVKQFETNYYPECCMCIMSFEEGESYVIYADKPDESRDFWRTSAYGLSKKLSELTPKELKYLRHYSRKLITRQSNTDA